MLADRLIDQEADLPLKHLLASEAGMLERREGCARCDEDDPAHLDRADPGKWWAYRPSPEADGESGAPPHPHGHRPGERRRVADANPHLVDLRRELDEHQA
ncbi:MAG: hypothetical protein E6K11_09975 [Methanobacteriota archaeon]|nr:MAG: hypothetical protein E6K11_09975 [Euryarchaeota archaeon]